MNDSSFDSVNSLSILYLLEFVGITDQAGNIEYNKTEIDRFGNYEVLLKSIKTEVLIFFQILEFK